MRVLVTGGNGFIGRATTAELASQGFEPLVLDRHRDADGPFPVLLGDVRDATAVTEAMAHADAWVHLAGVLGTAETIRNPMPAAMTNVVGGLNVLEAAAQYGLPGVNIGVGNHWMTNTYSITKSTVERFAAMYRRERGLAVTTVRALNAYGPGQSVAAPYGPSKVRKITPSFVMRALHGDPVEVYGDGSQVMDMVHVRDVARVLVAALRRSVEHGGLESVPEAGTGRRTTVLDIAQAVVDAVGSGDIVRLPMRPGEDPSSVVLADTATLAPLAPYGIDPTRFVSLEHGIAETVAYYRRTML